MTDWREKWGQRIMEIPDRIRKQRPLVHMIPNSVTVSLCTDGLSALGARPLMAKAPEEMEEIVSYADALVVNMGQPDAEKLKAAEIALRTAEKRKMPIVWDPVGAGASRYRKEACQKLLCLPWTGIVKGNRSEIAALQTELLPHHGIDAVGEVVVQYHAEDQRIWAVSGKEDVVFSKEEHWHLSHEEGKKLILTGTGCLTGAVMGACHAVEEDPMVAAMAAFVIMASAGREAGKQCGYGSQKTALLDALTKVSEMVEDTLLKC